MIKSLEPALGGKMDVQVIAARYIPEQNKTIILLKASDLDLLNETKNSPLLLQDEFAGSMLASDYGQVPGFNLVVTEHGKIISLAFLKVLEWINGVDLIQISYNSYGAAPNPDWKDVKIKLGLPKDRGYTYVGNFDLSRYATDKLDPEQPYIFLYDLADRDLNQKYKSTINNLKTENRNDEVAQLRSSQRDWIKLKEQNCANRNESAMVGTNGRCKLLYTVERINFLRRIK